MWRLQGFDSDEFVSRYWQKQPCLLRNAFADFQSPVSPEELAGLSCEADVHCRLVIENGDDGPWQPRYGPFEEDDFLKLPDSGYSLLVSECEKWMPEFEDLVRQFNFIPGWRFYDLMISYAPPGGSVGPHIDEYDVFLLQAMGTRRWKYNDSRIDNPRLIAGLDLAILEEFEPEREVVLNPGDILYLPPGCAHHGIALERCMTYSVGFHAPDALATLESFALEIERIGIDTPGYNDSDLELDRHNAEITDAEIAKFKALATGLLEQSPQLWRDVVGKMVSDSAIAQEDEGNQPVYVSDLQAGGWVRHPDTRLYFHESQHDIRVYCNGRMHELPRNDENRMLLQQLCEQHEWPVELISRCIDNDAFQKLLAGLAATHAILPNDE